MSVPRSKRSNTVQAKLPGTAGGLEEVLIDAAIGEQRAQRFDQTHRPSRHAPRGNARHRRTAAVVEPAEEVMPVAG
jgi:hypothetical protein